MIGSSVGAFSVQVHEQHVSPRREVWPPRYFSVISGCTLPFSTRIRMRDSALAFENRSSMSSGLFVWISVA
jgi:hypothetical protein